MLSATIIIIKKSKVIFVILTNTYGIMYLPQLPPRSGGYFSVNIKPSDYLNYQ